MRKREGRGDPWAPLSGNSLPGSQGSILQPWTLQLPQYLPQPALRTQLQLGRAVLGFEEAHPLALRQEAVGDLPGLTAPISAKERDSLGGLAVQSEVSRLGFGKTRGRRRR